MSDQTSRTALVTGANRGIGLETARQLALRGLKVIATDLGTDHSSEAKEQLHALDVVYRQLDVTLDGQVAEVTCELLEKFGRIDVLVNNAGMQGDPGVLEIPEDAVAASFFRADVNTAIQTMNTNAFGAFRLCQTLVPLMREHGYGRVVNVASGAGQLTAMTGGWACYRMSKTAMNALTRIVAAEVEGEDVLVNSVCPGWVRTKMGGATAVRSVEEGVDSIAWLATLPRGGPSGGFFRDRQSIPW